MTYDYDGKRYEVKHAGKVAEVPYPDSIVTHHHFKMLLDGKGVSTESISHSTKIHQAVRDLVAAGINCTLEKRDDAKTYLVFA